MRETGSLFFWTARRQWCADVRLAGETKRTRWNLGKGKVVCCGRSADARGRAPCVHECRARNAFHLRMAQAYHATAPPTDGTGALTVEALMVRYYRWTLAHRAPATAAFRRTYLQWLRSEAVCRVLPEELTPADLDRIVARKRAAGKAPRSLNHFVTCVKAMYRWAVRQGLLLDNPIAYVQGVPAAPPVKRALSDAEVKAAIRCAEKAPPLADVARVLVNTGLRIGELAGLPWSAYDPAEGVLIIEQHKTTGRGKPPRYVALNATARQVVERQPRTGPMIFSQADGAPWTARALGQKWQRLKKAHPKALQNAGAPGHGVTFHAFRHTFVSRAMNRGMPEAVVQQAVGHSSQLMVRYYTRASMEALRRIADAVEDAS